MPIGPKSDRSAHPKKPVKGVLSVIRKGVGYLPFENNQDIEIDNVNLSGALSGDTVEVELTGLFPLGRARPTGEARPRGKVRKVIARAKEEFVATIKDAHTAQADDVRVYRPFALAEESNYAPGEKVLVRLISFDGKADPKGMIVKHLGRAGEHKVEMNAIVLVHGFSTEIPEEEEGGGREG